MPDYITKSSLDKPIGSDVKKGEREKLDPVVSAPVKPKQRTVWDKIKDEFVSEDGQSIGDYILIEVLIPAVKNTIQSMVNNAVDMFLYGSGGSRYGQPRPYGGMQGSRVSYRQYYDQRPANNTNYARPRTTYGYDYNEVVFESRQDAEAVLYRMEETLANYQCVRVADYLELSGRNSNYTDNNYGWTSLETVQIRRSRDNGYYLDLPRPMALD